MTSIRGFVHYAGVLPVGRPDDPSPIRPATLENDRFPNEQRSLRERALRALSRVLIAFCTGVAAMAWWSYGDAARQTIANSYPQFRWLAPRHAAIVQKTPDSIALAGSAAPRPDQLDEALRDLHAMRLGLDRIASGQELITRSIDEIAANVVAGLERVTRSADQTDASIAAGQEPTTRSTNWTAATIAAGQEQMTRNTDQTATDIDQAPLKATSIPVESRTDGPSVQPAARLNMKPTEAKPPQTLSERGRQLSAASRHDASCFPSASAVAQNYPGGWPTWTLRAPGHEGTVCWYAAARARGSDHLPRISDPRSEKTPGKEIVGTTENRLPAPPVPYVRPAE